MSCAIHSFGGVEKIKRFWIIAILAVAALIFAEVKNPDTIITVTIGEPDTLDPHYAYDTASGEVLTQIYECLIEYVGDSVIQMAPRLATTVPSLENLRSGKQPSAQG